MPLPSPQCRQRAASIGSLRRRKNILISWRPRKQKWGWRKPKEGSDQLKKREGIQGATEKKFPREDANKVNLLNLLNLLNLHWHRSKAINANRCGEAENGACNSVPRSVRLLAPMPQMIEPTHWSIMHIERLPKPGGSRRSARFPPSRRR